MACYGSTGVSEGGVPRVHQARGRTHSRVRLGRTWNESRIGEVMATSRVALVRGTKQMKGKAEKVQG